MVVVVEEAVVAAVVVVVVAVDAADAVAAKEDLPMAHNRIHDNMPGIGAPPYRPQGLLLQWHVTNRCNLRCSHCYQESYGGAELDFTELTETLHQYETMLDQWRTQATTAHERVRGHITLTGGEPFVRSDFVRFLELIAQKQRSFSFAILTNGSLIDLSIARRLRSLRPRFVQVSMEGTEATHDQIRGQGDFQRTVRAIQLLRRFGVRTMISFTAHKDNYREFTDVARIGIRLGVDRIWSDRFIPNAGTSGPAKAQALSPDETHEFFSIMASAKQEGSRRWFCRTEITMHRALQFLIEEGTPYRCTAGDSLITLMPDGEVYPCRRMPISVGNIRRTPLSEIYFNHPFLRQLRDPRHTSADCTGCAYATRCRGGLKCLSYATTGNPFQRDPGCWLPSNQSAQEAAENLSMIK